MRIGLIDGDLVAFRCAATCNNEAFKIAVYRMEDMLDRIFKTISAPEYKMYLTGKNNFRKKIDPEYKANRKDKEKPIHLEDCRNYLIEKYNAVVTEGIEADDALGIEQCRNLGTETETVICSIDKDLLQIPGKHYNFLKEVKMEVTTIEGLRHFYKQLLIGDKSDNVEGVRGIGPVNAARIIDPLEDEHEMYTAVLERYAGDKERLRKNCNLLWIMREEGELWQDRFMEIKYGETTVSESEGQEPTEVGER